VFVARNGPEFEQMTKTKQKDNSKFEFLFGGRHFDYYMYKVTTEQASKCTNTMTTTTLVLACLRSWCNLFFP